MTMTRRTASDADTAQVNRDGIQVVAWRCDHCRKFQPNEIQSRTVYVEDSGPMRDSGPIVKARSRTIARMIVCPPCARKLGAPGRLGN